MKGSGLMFVFLLLLLIFATVNNSQHCSSVTCSRDSSKNQSESEKVLTIGLLLPKEVSDQDEMSYYNRLDQVKMGLEVLTADPNSTNLGSYKNPLPSVLPGWKIKVITGDTGCSSTIGPLEAVKLHCEADVFLGPVCTYSLASVCRFAAHWNKPVITTGGEREVFRKKKKDFRLLTTMANFYGDELTEFVREFLNQTDWNVIRFLFHNYKPEEGKGDTKCQNTLRSMFLKLGGGTHNGVTNQNLTFESFNQDNLNKSVIEGILKRVEEKARVVILCAAPSKVREILLTAHELGMMKNGEYVFFNVELFTNSEVGLYKPWYDSKDSNETNERAKEAYEAVLTVTASYSSKSAEYRAFDNATRTLAKEKFGVEYEGPVNNFVANFHDAVLLYATALSKAIEEQGLEAKSNGSLIVEKIWKSTIQGVSGNVSINGNGDREADYALLDMDPETGRFDEVILYIGTTKSFEEIPNKKIHWPKRDTHPKDTPDCGFDGSLCKTENDIPGG